MPGGLHPPIEVLLSWTPNYVDPASKGPIVPILAMVLLALCYTVVALRIYTRLRLSRNFGLDDGLILFNMIPLTGEAICLYLAFTKYGFNHHVWDDRIPVLVQSRKITMALEATYLTSTACTKISILLFYRRLGVGTVTNRFLYSVYAAIAFVLAYYITFTVNLFVGCRPINAFWNQADLVWLAENDGKYSCFDEATNMIAAAVISVLQDFIACFMPTILFWKLRIRRQQKFALCAIFGVGFFLCICGILRISNTTKIYYKTYDMTWESEGAWIWFTVESHIAVVCASAPALNYFVKHAHNGSSVGSYLQDAARNVKYGYSRTKSSSNITTTTGNRASVTGNNITNQDTSQFTLKTSSKMEVESYMEDDDEGTELELQEKMPRIGAPSSRSRGEDLGEEGVEISWLSVGDISDNSGSEGSLFRDVEANPGVRRPPSVYTSRLSAEYSNIR